MSDLLSLFSVHIGHVYHHPGPADGLLHATRQLEGLAVELHSAGGSASLRLRGSRSPPCLCRSFTGSWGGGEECLWFLAARRDGYDMPGKHPRLDARFSRWFSSTTPEPSSGSGFVPILTRICTRVAIKKGGKDQPLLRKKLL